MHTLGKRILRNDEPVAEDGGVVPDPMRESAPLELPQEPELTEL